MAVTLADVVFRRTDLASAEYPGDDQLRQCSSIVAQELGWGPDRLNAELRNVREAFPFALANPETTTTPEPDVQR